MEILARWAAVVLLALLLTLTGSGVTGAEAAPSVSSETCTYNTWAWDTRAKRSTAHRRVRKPRADLTPAERDPHSSCTVCEEDQEEIRLPGVAPFRVCRDVAPTVRAALEKIQASGFPIFSVVGYRVGLTKGPVDTHGRRTQFSHHSFGTAVDLNPERNGLYVNCFRFGPACRLSLGGAWRPGRPGTVTPDSIAYQAFREAGWKWGGELVGRQKDFMHFSLSGD